MSGLVIVDPPAGEPVSLIEAQQHLRTIDGDTSQDTLIESCITAARAHAEMITRRALISQTWLMTLDCFPGYGFLAPLVWGAFGTGLGVLSYSVVPTRGNDIIIPMPPLISIDSIVYIDLNGTETTLNSSKYQVTLADEPARVMPAYGETWPATRTEADAVRIQFTCGYGGGESDVPEGIRRWMLLRVGAFYENREEIVVDYLKVSDLLFVNSLLDPYRIYRF